MVKWIYRILVVGGVVVLGFVPILGWAFVGWVLGVVIAGRYRTPRSLKRVHS